MTTAPPSEPADVPAAPSSTRAPRRVLLVENTVRGIGGSYESLFVTAKGLHRDRFEPVVLFFQENHYVRRLEALGIKVLVGDSRRFWEKEGYIKATGKVRSALPRAGLLGKTRRAGVALARAIVGGLPMAWTVYRAIRRERIDLLHSNNNLERDAMVILGGLLAGVPVVAHERQMTRLSGFARLLSGRVKTLICISDAVREFSRTSGARTRDRRLVHNAIDLAEIRAARPSLAPGPPRFGIVGRVMARKGQRYFIAAARRVRDEVPGAEFYIVGKATEEERAYEEELRRLVKELGLEAAVKWTGHVESPLGLMASLDAVVHAAVEPEPFGRVIIEALALGVPVIATALGGPVEIIEDGVSGFLVAPRDPEALAEKMAALVREPALAARLRAAAADLAAARFDSPRYIRAIEAIYAEAVGDAPGADSGGPDRDRGVAPAGATPPELASTGRAPAEKGLAP